ncbi:MAG: TIGR04372 family glycosyltransferase [Rhodospirillales bacterium]
METVTPSLNFYQRCLIRARAYASDHRESIIVRLARALLSLGYHLRNLAASAALPIARAGARLPGLRFAPFLSVALRDLSSQMTLATEIETFDPARVEALQSRASDLFQRLNKARPGSSEHWDSMSRIAYKTGDIDACGEMAAKAFTLREARIRDKGLDRLGLRLIPTSIFIRTIGNVAAFETYVRAGRLGLRENSRLVLPLHPEIKRQFAANPAYIDYWRRYIDVVEDRKELAQLERLDEDLYVDPRVIDINGQPLPFLHSAVARIQAEWESRNLPHLFDLDEEHAARGWQTLAGYGVAPGEWFVCLHVRTGGFKGGDAFREADIADYLDSIHAITARGGWVVRMGDPSMPPLPAMERVIDYALSPDKSDWLDVFLCAACRFFIGTSSGLYIVSDTFGRPFVQTNFLPTGAVFFRPGNLFIPKRLFDLATGKELPLGEVMSGRVSYAASNGAYRNILKLGWKNNSAEEIRTAVIEMMDRLDGTANYTADEELAQTAFREMTARNGTLPGLDNFPIRCRISQHFLNQSII